MVKKEDVHDDELKKNGKVDKPKAFTIKYKRPRGSRACTVCRSRKVRCDAEIHIPCTNCITFGCECSLPEAKKRGNGSSEPKSKRRKVDEEEALDDDDGSSPENSFIAEKIRSIKQVASKETQSNEPILNISQVSLPPSLTSNYKTRPTIHKREILKLKSKSQSLTFLGSLSIGVVAQEVGENHVTLTEDMFEMRDDALDSVELEILKLRGCFLLPSRELCLDLIESYFIHVHPLMPVINRTEFMAKVNDPDDNPSLMLMQSVLLSGCRVSSNPLLFDLLGLKNLASMTFFGRAKALYEANYESDPVCLIQTLILIGSFWEGPEDVTKNLYYWTKVAIALAQGFGFQRDVSGLEKQTTLEKKIWRRIWWCLFEKDRNVAIAFGRPAVIDLNDCDVPMLSVEDFDENDPEVGVVSPYQVDITQALYFIHLVKLAEITGIIIKHQYLVKSEQLKMKSKFLIIQHCDMLMGIWFTNLPPQLVFSVGNAANQNFYCCLLNAQYYNRLYLIHRSNLIRMAKSSSTNPNNYKYPSWGISFQAARMISMVSKILLERDQLQYCPVIFVYILFSAMMMLIYHVDSSSEVVAVTAKESLFISRVVLKKLATTYPIAGVLHKLFDKYADDRIKRAKVIERGSKIAEYQELTANRKAVSESERMQHHKEKPYESPKTFSYKHGSPAASNVSGVSPGSGVYPLDMQKYEEAHIQQLSDQQHQLNKQQSTTRLEDLVHRVKKKPDGSDKDNETSPSLTLSFPEVSLVTETMPNHQNFFENFEPTQLFPDVRESLPPTRMQSPQLGEVVGSNVYAREDADFLIGTPGGTLNTNFVDSSFVNMNLQSNLEGNYLLEDFGSLFMQ